MPQDITILKDPQLPQSADYEYLRSKGLEYIEKLGSRLWTDYNIHDPGITLLELLCYAITDLGYRTGLDTKDLLTGVLGGIDDPDRQAFYTAREIMTTSPLTQADYRKILIDIDGIRNGWMQCKSCGCDDHYLYADCKTSSLKYEPTNHRITLKGMYDVLVEFEDEEGIGNLNNGKIKYNFPFNTESKLTNATIEMRLPSWHEIEEDPETYEALRNPALYVKEVLMDADHPLIVSGNKTDGDIPGEELANTLRRPVYVTMTVRLGIVADPGTLLGDVTMQLKAVPATLWFHNDDERKAVDMGDIKGAIRDVSVSGIIPRYAERVRKADEIIAIVRNELQSNRNLCEDYCSIKAVQTEEIAICADIDVTPDADIEKVMAQAYFLADQYMSTDIKFYSLKELLDAGKPTDEIFDGPKLDNGFIDNDQLESTQLKTVLHTSDLINLFMDIPGVAAVRNFTMVRYDRDGNRSEAQSWSMDVMYNYQPRLYLEGSKLVAYKNGLPFLPDKLELSDTLQVIKGQHIQPKYSLVDLDIAVPGGSYYPLTDYYPLQYSLPNTYGVGPAGLPTHVSVERRVQAEQLKAYILFFEQMLVNYLEQLNHVKDLFSLDEDVDRSYYTRLLGEADIKGVSSLYSSTLDQAKLDSLAEDGATFLNRRNRFLDHLLSRFAEQFTDYTLMVYAYTDSKKVADESLIKDKIAFLRDYPFISRNRARAFNYKDAGHVCSVENIAGLQRRIERLLGFKGLDDNIKIVVEKDAFKWQLVDNTGNLLLTSASAYPFTGTTDAESLAKDAVYDTIDYLGNSSLYNVRKSKQWVLDLKSPDGTLLATRQQPFGKKVDAQAAIQNILDLINSIDISERIYIVEHLLLRPRNWTPFEYRPPLAPNDFPHLPGDILEAAQMISPNRQLQNQIDAILLPADPLMSICIPPDCNTCGDEDPYSFRMSIIMNGAEGLAASGVEFRRFAEETIRMEIPAHIGLKICWVDNDQLTDFGDAFCTWQSELAKEEPDPANMQNYLQNLLTIFGQLRNVYPPARLHDCAEGSEDSRVYLNHTII